MAVIFNSTASSPTANSYLSVIEADDYNSRTNNDSSWAILATGEKERLLMWATSLIDSHFEFIGARTNFYQALKWPRFDIIVDDKIYSKDIVPQQVKDATAEMAKVLRTTNTTIDTRTGEISSIKIGSIGVDFKTDADQYQKTIPSIVNELLAEFINSQLGAGASVRWLR